MIWTVCGLRGPDKQPGVVPAGRRAGRWPSGGSGGLAQGLQVVPDIRRRPRARLLSETMDELLASCFIRYDMPVMHFLERAASRSWSDSSSPSPSPPPAGKPARFHRRADAVLAPAPWASSVSASASDTASRARSPAGFSRATANPRTLHAQHRYHRVRQAQRNRREVSRSHLTLLSGPGERFEPQPVPPHAWRHGGITANAIAPQFPGRRRPTAAAARPAGLPGVRPGSPHCASAPFPSC